MKPKYVRDSIPLEHRNTLLWRQVDASLIDDGPHRQRFLKMQKAIEAYIANGASVATIECRHGLNRKQILRAVNRCLTVGHDGLPLGWAGLIPNLRIAPFYRKAGFPRSVSGRGGYAGTFLMLLNEHPNLLSKLRAQVLKQKREITVYEVNQLIESLHRMFLSWCTDEGLKANEYPFNTASKAKRSISRFVRDLRRTHLSQGLRAQGLRDAAHRLNVGTGHPATNFALSPFDVVQMDAHRLHCVGTVKVPSKTGFTLVPIQRMSLIIVAEVFSQAVLGYALVVRREPKANDVVAAINAAISVWTPRDIRIPGLQYAPNAGFPSGLIPKLAGVAWALLQVDNALVHYADALVERVRRRVGFAVNFGPFATWERRPIVESIFGRLEERGFQRLASSTGTGPQDETIDDANAAAVKYQIENRELIDIVELVIAAHNAKPIAAMGMKSPLDILRDFAECQDRDFLARTLPPAGGGIAELDVQIERRLVRGNRETGRRPYVEIDNVHYTSPVLSDAFGLIGTELTLHLKETDMRAIKSFLSDGRELGDLTAQGRWSWAPCTREEGRLIRSLMNRGVIAVAPNADPVEAYHRHLAGKAQAAARKQQHKRPKTNREATTIERIQAEGRGTPVLNELQAASPKPVSPLSASLPLGRFASILAGNGTGKAGAK